MPTAGLIGARRVLTREPMSSHHDRVGIGVYVILRHEGRVLLGRRLTPPGAHTWQFPGGKLEFGETIEACAARETLEEAGIVVGQLVRGPYTSDVFGPGEPHDVTGSIAMAPWRGTSLCWRRGGQPDRRDVGRGVTCAR